MYEIPQDGEQYILQWWDYDSHRRGQWTYSDYEEAAHWMERYKQNDKTWGDNFKYRIVRKTTKHEVVYDE